MLWVHLWWFEKVRTPRDDRTISMERQKYFLFSNSKLICSCKLYQPLRCSTRLCFFFQVLGWGFVWALEAKRPDLFIISPTSNTRASKTLENVGLNILQFERARVLIFWEKRSILSGAMNVGVGKAALERSVLIESGRGSRWELRSADQSIITPSVSLCGEHCAIVLDGRVTSVQHSHCLRSILAYSLHLLLFSRYHLPF